MVHSTAAVPGSTVYALVDPRTHLIRYVGITRGPVTVRYAQHLGAARAAEYPVARWIAQLKALGTKPILAVLEGDIGPACAAAREYWWIAQCRAAGLPLLNVRMENHPWGSPASYALRHEEDLRSEMGRNEDMDIPGTLYRERKLVRRYLAERPCALSRSASCSALRLYRDWDKWLYYDARAGMWLDKRRFAALVWEFLVEQGIGMRGDPNPINGVWTGISFPMCEGPTKSGYPCFHPLMPGQPYCLNHSCKALNGELGDKAKERLEAILRAMKAVRKAAR